ncbi:MAG: hypothetical protein GX639_22290 [Fibrobacter sp.]|nr:hypothetical protein [Fibrobacter sp.]
MENVVEEEIKIKVKIKIKVEVEEEKEEEEEGEEDEIGKCVMCAAFSYFMNSSDRMSKSPSFPPLYTCGEGVGG